MNGDDLEDDDLYLDDVSFDVVSSSLCLSNGRLPHVTDDYEQRSRVTSQGLARDALCHSREVKESAFSLIGGIQDILDSVTLSDPDPRIVSYNRRLSSENLSHDTTRNPRRLT